MKTALVTGASRGIGHAIASRLLSEGYKVVGTSTSKEGADKLSKQGIEGYVLNLNNLKTGCSPCLLEAKKMQQKISDREVSKIKIEEIKKIVSSLFKKD